MKTLHDDDRTLDLLRACDPLVDAADDVSPDSPMAQRVRTMAQASAPPAVPRTAPARPRRSAAAIAVTGCLAAAGVAVGVGLDGGGGTAPDARAALIDAAQRTASFDAGRIVWHMTFDDPQSGYDIDAINDVRYDGADVDTHAETREHGLSGDPRLSVHRSDYRLVSGQAYLRSGDGPWKTVPSPDDRGKSGAAQWQAILESAKSLGTLARRAPDVRRADQEGHTTFRATVDGRDITGPLANQWAEAGSGIALAVTVDEDDLVQRITLDKGPSHVDVTFAALGEPQGITAP